MTNTNSTRSVSVSGLTAYYVTSIVGAGILIVPSLASRIAGPASLLAWCFLTVISYPFAMVFSRISIEFPSNAGIFEFIQSRFGDFTSRTLLLLFMITHFIGNPVIGIASARYLQNVIHF